MGNAPGWSYEVLVTSRAQLREYWKDLKTKVSINDPRGQFVGGKGSVSVILGDRTLMLRAARKLPDSVCFGLSPDSFSRVTMGTFEWDDTTGSIWNRVTDATGRKDAFYAVGNYYEELICKAPRKNFVQVPDAPSLGPTNLTVEAWVWFDSLDSPDSGGVPPGQTYLVFKQNSRAAAFEGFSLAKDRDADGDKFSFGVSSAAGTALEARSSTLVATGVWYHVAGVRGPDTLQIYVNGQLEASATGRVNTTKDGDVVLGICNAISRSVFRGRIDDFVIYGDALAPNQLAALASDTVRPDASLPDPILSPLLSVGPCAWSVREIYAHTSPVRYLAAAEYIAHNPQLGTVLDYESGVIWRTAPKPASVPAAQDPETDVPNTKGV